MRKLKAKIVCAVASVMAMLNIAAMNAYAAGDVASAVESTWTTAKGQIQTVVNNVVFPVIDVILGVLLFVKIATAYLEYRKHGTYLEYRKHGTLEWTPIAIIFGGLLFSLTAPLYVWTIL